MCICCQLLPAVLGSHYGRVQLNITCIDYHPLVLTNWTQFNPRVQFKVCYLLLYSTVN